MTKLMKVVQANAFGGPEVLELVEKNIPEVAPNEVLVKLSYSGVSFNDYMVRTDFYRHPGKSAPEVPFVLGEEGAGVVEVLGEKVANINPGQRVGFIWHGSKTYSQYVAVPADRLVPIPDDVSDQEMIALTHSGLTARALLHEYKELSKSTTVLVTAGSGSIGSLLVEWATHLGAKVIATVSSDRNKAWVKSLGAHQVINVYEEDLVVEIEKSTSGRGVDLALDSVGGDGFDQVFKALGKRGIVVPFGVAGGKYPKVDPLALIDRSRILAGFMFFDFIESRSELIKHTNTVFDAFRKGYITPVIAETFPLEKASDAHMAFEERGRKGRILLRID